MMPFDTGPGMFPPIFVRFRIPGSPVFISVPGSPDFVASRDPAAVRLVSAHSAAARRPLRRRAVPAVVRLASVARFSPAPFTSPPPRV